MFAFIGMPGPFEMCIIGGIAILLFGSRLPSVARDVGRSILSFKAGIKDIEQELEETKEAIEKKPEL